MTRYSLEGQVAIITGGGSGIGERIATTYAGAGADIVLAGRTRARLERVAGEVQALGRRALAVPTDVCVEDQVKALVARAVERFDRIDILVNNAGAAITFKNVEQLTLEEWNATVALNLTGPFLCSTAAGRIMIKRQRGKIINVASAAGLKGYSFMAHYSAAKSGLMRLTEALASGWARYNINVNCIVPGLIATEVEIERGSIPPATRKDGTPVPPLLYPPAPENVAELALFLASPAADHISGELMMIRAANA